MDLSLALGQPAELLARTMTEREFRRWQMYRRKHLFPMQRLELYLAQVAQILAITMGGAKDAKIGDYMIELKYAADAAPEVDVEAARQAFKYNPRKKRN